MTETTPEEPRPRQLNPTGLAILTAVSLCMGSAAFVMLWPSEPATVPTSRYVRESAEVRGQRALEASEVWRSPIPPLSAPEGLDPRRVALGGRLFHDPILSLDQTISCSSCHDLAAGGDDGRVRSIGVGGAVGAINAPTVLNSVHNFRQFWDGRATTLEEQIEGPIQHPDEMNMSWEDVVGRIAADEDYRTGFEEAYGMPPGVESIKDAIASFERSLVTLDSPFDRYLRGEEQAMDKGARRGWALFQAVGCVACHQGANAGGNMFQTFGSVADYFEGRDDLTPADLGRFNVTGDERDRHRFKVPTLRNVAQTAPYFHDGHAATLPEAIQSMALHQLGETLPESEVSDLESFLHALTGELPESARAHGQRE